MSAAARPASFPWALAVLVVLGNALFNSAMSASLIDTAPGSWAVSFTSRFVVVATYAAAAVLFRRRLPSTRHLFVGAMPCMVLSVVLAAAGDAAPDGGWGLFCAYASQVTRGVSSSLFTLFGLCVFASFSFKACALMLACSKLVADCLLMLFAVLDPAGVFAVKSAFLLMGSAAFLLIARGWAPGEAAPARQGPTGCAARRSFPASRIEWLLLLATAFMFCGFFGVTAQLSSPATSSFALYEIQTAVVVVAFDALLLAFLAVRGDRFGFAAVVVSVVALYATGFALYSYSWAGGSFLAGALIRSGFNYSTVLMRSLVARKVHVDPEKAYLYFGLLLSFSSVSLGRVLGLALAGSGASQTGLLQALSLVALWSIAFFGIAAFLVANRGLTDAPGHGAPQAGMDVPDGSGCARDAGAAPGRDAFSERVERFSARLQLSDREREVMVEALHGYSRVGIAEKLCLSPETVKSYLGRVYRKAGVNSKQELVALVEKEDLSA